MDEDEAIADTGEDASRNDWEDPKTLERRREYSEG
jgi:hypothetical protein